MTGVKNKVVFRTYSDIIKEVNETFSNPDKTSDEFVAELVESVVLSVLENFANFSYELPEVDVVIIPLSVLFIDNNESVIHRMSIDEEQMWDGYGMKQFLMNKEGDIIDFLQVVFNSHLNSIQMTNDTGPNNSVGIAKMLSDVLPNKKKDFGGHKKNATISVLQELTFAKFELSNILQEQITQNIEFDFEEGQIRIYTDDLPFDKDVNLSLVEVIEKLIERSVRDIVAVYIITPDVLSSIEYMSRLNRGEFNSSYVATEILVWILFILLLLLMAKGIIEGAISSGKLVVKALSKTKDKKKL
jgi:hypothetical protein